MSNLRYQDEIERLERERDALLSRLSPEERAEYERVQENFAKSTRTGPEPQPDTVPEQK